MRLDEFITLLEKERKKSREKNPIVNIGGENKDKGAVIGDFKIYNAESLGDRMVNAIFIIAKAYI